MIPDCISFNSIPHTTRIFSDFLSYSPEIRKFFPTPPDVEHVVAFAKSVPRDRERQARVADALEKQNRAWGASEATLRNIQRLRDGAFAVVTGQQVGLFGGPLMSLFKAASVLALAKQVEQSGVECVPVFWMATEDHDLDEVNQALLLTHDFQLAPFTAKTAGVPGAPVAHIRFAEGTQRRSSPKRLSCWANRWPPITCARATPKARPSPTRSPSFTRASLRASMGLSSSIRATLSCIALRRRCLWTRCAAPPNSIRRCWSATRSCVTAAITNRSRSRENPLRCLLWWMECACPCIAPMGPSRLREKTVSAEELQKRIETAPENFSANVLLRPVLQDYWLPTLAYIGGPAEIAYFAQAAVVYEKLLGRITPILPRMSATLIEPRIERLLSKYEVELPELFHGECQLRDCLAARCAARRTQAGFRAGAASG